MIIKIFVSAFIVKYTKTLSVIPWSKRLTLRHGNIPVVFHTYLFTFNYCVALYFLSCENSRACLLFLNQIDIAFIFFLSDVDQCISEICKIIQNLFFQVKKVKNVRVEKILIQQCPASPTNFIFPCISYIIRPLIIIRSSSHARIGIFFFFFFFFCK